MPWSDKAWTTVQVAQINDFACPQVIPLGTQLTIPVLVDTDISASTAQQRGRSIRVIGEFDVWAGTDEPTQSDFDWSLLRWALLELDNDQGEAGGLALPTLFGDEFWQTERILASGQTAVSAIRMPSTLTGPTMQTPAHISIDVKPPIRVETGLGLWLIMEPLQCTVLFSREVLAMGYTRCLFLT